MTDDRALVLLEHPATTTGSPARPRLADPGDPDLYVGDRGVLRGHGAFQLVHGVDRKVIAAEDHLNRLARSWTRLSLPLPDPGARRLAMDLAIQARAEDGEFALRLVLTEAAA